MSEHTDKHGVVSVFLGVFPGKDVFDNYLRETRNEDSSVIATTCPLWDELGVVWLDHDFQDAHYQGDVPVPPSVFLSNPISYIDSFRSGVVESCARLGIDKVNAGVFLFNYEHPATQLFRSPYLQFVGCFNYNVFMPNWFRDLIS